MNKTKIEWCDSTWNPVTGCLHGCEYCYARNIAHRFGGYWDSEALRRRGADGSIHELDAQMTRHTTGKNRDKGVHNVVAPYPYCFDPTLHRYKLDDPQKWKKPRTIFVCSMADLFGWWVPGAWIEEVFAACERAPQHRYLFLTKNPQRYIELGLTGKLPERDNMWYGSTATTTDTLVFSSDRHNTFMSIEPIMEPFDGRYPAYATPGIDWFIIGAETGNRANKVTPEKNWIEPIVNACKKSGRPLFMKESLAPVWGDDLITEFPWEVK